MDGRLIRCDACGIGITRAVPLCPRCATPCPGGLRTLDEYLKTEHHTLRLAGLVVMWASTVLSLTIVATFAGIFIARLG